MAIKKGGASCPELDVKKIESEVSRNKRLRAQSKSVASLIKQSFRHLSKVNRPDYVSNSGSLTFPRRFGATYGAILWLIAPNRSSFKILVCRNDDAVREVYRVLESMYLDRNQYEILSLGRIQHAVKSREPQEILFDGCKGLNYMGTQDEKHLIPSLMGINRSIIFMDTSL